MSLHSVPAAEDPPGPHARDWLSAAVDGDREAMGKACHAWRDDPQARADWHAYHLIGDVMRSDELAAPAARDAAFLNRLRQRLATEPVLLAPSPQQSVTPRAAPAWRLPAALAAGIVVVAGVLVVSRMSAPESEGSGQPLAAVSLPSGPIVVSNGASLQAVAGTRGVVIRDPRLDEFLRAHQSAKGGFAAAVPGSSLRRVDVEITPGASR